jgi:hypothetical protein
LPLQAVQGIGAAFKEYIRVLLGRSFAELHELAQAADRAYLEHLYTLPDARPN